MVMTTEWPGVKLAVCAEIAHGEGEAKLIKLINANQLSEEVIASVPLGPELGLGCAALCLNLHIYYFRVDGVVKLPKSFGVRTDKEASEELFGLLAAAICGA